jgi:hypothetical protein
VCPYWNWIILKDVWHSTKRLFLVHSSSYEVTCVESYLCLGCSKMFALIFSGHFPDVILYKINVYEPFWISVLLWLFWFLMLKKFFLFFNNSSSWTMTFLGSPLWNSLFFFFCNPLTVNYREILVKGLVSICFSLHSPVTMHSDFSLWWTNNSLH